MKIIRGLEFHTGSKEEKLPDFDLDFPYICSRAELDHYEQSLVPWHWHRAVEIFYMESGKLEYFTPKGSWVFPAGSGGMVNSNILHMTKFSPHMEKNVQLLHIFEPDLIGGKLDSLLLHRRMLNKNLFKNGKSQVYKRPGSWCGMDAHV